MVSNELTPLNGSRRPTNKDTADCCILLLNILVCSVVFLVFMAFATSFRIVDPGDMGVALWLGKLSVCQTSSYCWVKPLSGFHHMSIKTQKLEEHNVVPTKEGLSVELDTVVLYRLNPHMVGKLYQEVGLDYVNVLVQPEVSSAVRCYTSEFEAKALYTSGRERIQEDLRASLAAKLEPRGVVVEDFLLKDLKLPDMLAASIELKLQTEQEAKQMVFVLEREELEAQRKAVEAKGISTFQKIVSEGISEQLLQWKGIEATEKLAQSPNSKLVVMGNGEKGLPVLLSAGGAGQTPNLRGAALPAGP